MAFISKADLYLSILQDELEEITRNDDVLIASACGAAEAEMRTYLFDNYDVAVIFAKVGALRHGLLVQLCADIALWFIVARLQAGQDTDDRKSRYDRAIAWLKQAQKSTMYSDLERRETTQQTHIAHGSQSKRSNYY